MGRLLSSARSAADMRDGDGAPHNLLMKRQILMDLDVRGGTRWVHRFRTIQADAKDLPRALR
jgi:hypothetical protein